MEVTPLLLADFTYPDSHPWRGRPGVVYGFVIRTGRGVVLVDTGIGPTHPDVDPYYHPTRRNLGALLSQIGVESSDVIAIVNTHLHFDHCGGNQDFTGLPVYVQRKEREAVHVKDYTIPEWVDFPGVSFRVVEGDYQLRSGIQLLATPGHTAGHQSVIVQTREGAILIAGHAVGTAKEWTGKEPLTEGSEAGVRSAQRLRKLSPKKVYFSHDGTPFESMDRSNAPSLKRDCRVRAGRTPRSDLENDAALGAGFPNELG
jgi:N-acyl homoserine lactone hydrolase